MAFGFLVIASILAAAIAFTINEKTAALQSLQALKSIQRG
jgi:hypothetical protein